MTRDNLKEILDLLLPSRVRVKILTLFFQNPLHEYHMRYVARITNEQINAVRRELMILEKVGFLISRANGMKKMYLLDKSFPLYAELRSLVMKNAPLGYYLYLNRQEIGTIKYAVLSHTYISGEKSDQHNVDLLIVGNPDQNKLIEIVNQAQKEEGKEIFYVVLSEYEFDNRKKRRDPLIYSLMVLPRAMLIGQDEEFVV